MKKNRLILSSILIGLALPNFGFDGNQTTLKPAPQAPEEVLCPPPIQSSLEPGLANTISTAASAAAKSQKIQCKELAVNQSRLVVAKDEESPTSVHHLYKLNRKAENDFEVVLNLEYRSATGTEDSALNAKFHALANHCYQEADKALLGPNGEHLHIRLATTDEASPIPPIHSINIVSGGARSDADHYNESLVDCPTILHESLHLMGLVDEYKELKLGLVLDPTAPSGKSWLNNAPITAWDCRAIGADDSIMSGTQTAWNKSFGSMRMSYLQLQCVCDSPKCKKAFLHPDPNARDCPDGAHDSIKQIFPENIESHTPGLQIISPTQFVLTKDMHKFTGTSLLKPAHFNAIVHPGCTENLPYYQCAANAYNTSKERNGDGCIEVPAFCHDGTANWTAGSVKSAP